jgi:hypothetical protein
MTTQYVLVDLTVVLGHAHVDNTKRDFYGVKHHLEVDRVRRYSVLKTSHPLTPSPNGVQTAVPQRKKMLGKTNQNHWKQKDHSTGVSNLCLVSLSFGENIKIIVGASPRYCMD